METTVLTERLADIDHRIEQKKAELARPDKFAGQKYLSRYCKLAGACLNMQCKNVIKFIMPSSLITK